MNKLFAAFAALLLASTAATADCNPTNKLSVVTTISARHHVSADMVADAWLTGEWFDSDTQKWNGTLMYHLKGEQEPLTAIPNASVPGACPARR